MSNGEITDDDLDALIANLNPQLVNAPSFKFKTKKEYNAELLRLTDESRKMLAKYKAEEEANKLNPPAEPDISEAELKAMMDEFAEGGKTRRHKRKQSGYSKKRTYRKKSMNKKKRTCRKKSMNKKKRTYRKKRA
jgi:hypothetical protein